MPTNQNRLNRINEQVTRQLMTLLPTVKDPRLSGLMISVLRCDVTNDLRWCKVYLSVMGDYQEKQLMQGLRSCSGFLRRELAHTLTLRYTPELVFVIDDSISHGAHIAQVLSGLDISHEPGDAETPDGE